MNLQRGASTVRNIIALLIVSIIGLVILNTFYPIRNLLANKSIEIFLFVDKGKDVSGFLKNNLGSIINECDINYNDNQDLHIYKIKPGGIAKGTDTYLFTTPNSKFVINYVKVITDTGQTTINNPFYNNNLPIEAQSYQTKLEAEKKALSDEYKKKIYITPIQSEIHGSLYDTLPVLYNNSEFDFITVQIFGTAYNEDKSISRAMLGHAIKVNSNTSGSFEFNREDLYNGSAKTLVWEQLVATTADGKELTIYFK